jgi:hypothetical protein
MDTDTEQASRVYIGKDQTNTAYIVVKLCQVSMVR